MAQSASPTYRSIREVAEIEAQALHQRSLAQCVGDAIANHAGRMWFILAHAVWFAIWIVLNVPSVSGLKPFDPFPFSFLTMVVSLEAIFLSLFILMSQNRATRQADQRAHLDLQINLLSEHENTKMLQMLQAICAHHGLHVGDDPEIDELAERTEPQQVLRELNDNLPAA